MRRSRVLAVFALGAGLTGTGCATATNYLDPEGPVYRGESGARPRPGPAIRIVTFNIEYALRVDRAIAALRSRPELRDPDVLVLQEMDAPGVEAIAQALHLNYVYYPASYHPKHLHDVGNAVLSPWPIEESWKLLLPHQSRMLKQGRAAVAARIRVAGRPLRVYALQLGSPFGVSGGARKHQADVVLADAGSSPDPVVLAGDLNSHAIGARIEAAGFAWLTKDVGASVHGFSFDHVFVRGLKLLGWEAGVAREVKDASDHRPVWAELRVEPDEGLPAAPAARSGGGDGGEEPAELLFFEPAVRPHSGADVEGERTDLGDRLREVLGP